MLSAVPASADHLVTLTYPVGTRPSSPIIFNGALSYTYTSATWNINQTVSISCAIAGIYHIPYVITSPYTTRTKSGEIVITFAEGAPSCQCIASDAGVLAATAALPDIFVSGLPYGMTSRNVPIIDTEDPYQRSVSGDGFLCVINWVILGPGLESVSVGLTMQSFPTHPEDNTHTWRVSSHGAGADENCPDIVVSGDCMTYTDGAWSTPPASFDLTGLVGGCDAPPPPEFCHNFNSVYIANMPFGEPECTFNPFSTTEGLDDILLVWTSGCGSAYLTCQISNIMEPESRTFYWELHVEGEGDTEYTYCVFGASSLTSVTMDCASNYWSLTAPGNLDQILSESSPDCEGWLPTIS